MRNLEPRVHRQRLVIEAKYGRDIDRELVRQYLLDLAKALEMTVHLEPIITSATGKGDPIHDGFEGVIFWLESGATIYVWERLKFLTVDIYTCKAFDTKKAIEFTKNYFNISELEHQEL